MKHEKAKRTKKKSGVRKLNVSKWGIIEESAAYYSQTESQKTSSEVGRLNLSAKQ